MVIILAIAFVAIAIIGSLIKRHFVKKRDKIDGPFNAGITHRSAPMISTNGPPLAYQNDGPIDSHPSHAPGGNAMYLPRVREKDRAIMQQKSLSSMVADPNVDGQGTPMEELPSSKARDKGKGKAVPDIKGSS